MDAGESSGQNHQGMMELENHLDPYIHGLKAQPPYYLLILQEKSGPLVQRNLAEPTLAQSSFGTIGPHVPSMYHVEDRAAVLGKPCQGAGPGPGPEQAS